MLLAFGSNGSGQLAIGNIDDVSVPTRCLNVPLACPFRITAGGNHTLLLDSNEKLWTSGRFINNLEIPVDTLQSNQFVEPKFSLFHESNLRFSLCAASWEASVLVRSDGEAAYSCGNGNRGELGQGKDITKSISGLQKLDFPPFGTRIVDLAGSMAHFIAVLSNGDVYGWGSGRKGQLGEPKEDCWVPRKVAGIPFKAVRAVCGRDFTYIVGSRESGDHIVLGSDKWNLQSNSPSKVGDWKAIGASWGGIYVLLESGQLVAWGRNDHGQLPPSGLPSIDKIAVGSEHVIATTNENDVLAWGWGEHGNCGEPIDERGNVVARWNVIPIKDNVLFIGAGCATSWVYVANKR